MITVNSARHAVMTRSWVGRSLALTLLLLAQFTAGQPDTELAQGVQPQAQQCGSRTEDVRRRGAKGDGKRDDSSAFQSLEEDPAAGVIFMPRGTYRISRDMTLRKPVVAVAGARFTVSAHGCFIGAVFVGPACSSSVISFPWLPAG